MEIASLASTTRMSVSLWMDSGCTQSMACDPNTIVSCSPNTWAIAFGPRSGHSEVMTDNPLLDTFHPWGVSLVARAHQAPEARHRSLRGTSSPCQTSRVVN